MQKNQRGGCRGGRGERIPLDKTLVSTRPIVGRGGGRGGDNTNVDHLDLCSEEDPTSHNGKRQFAPLRWPVLGWGAAGHGSSSWKNGYGSNIKSGTMNYSKGKLKQEGGKGNLRTK